MVCEMIPKDTAQEGLNIWGPAPHVSIVEIQHPTSQIETMRCFPNVSGKVWIFYQPNQHIKVPQFH